MWNPPLHRLILPAVVAVAGVGLAGCSFSASTTATVSESEVETQAESALAPKFEGEAPSIDCPSEIPAEVGATLTCTASLAGESADAIITITSVDENDQVQFDVNIPPTNPSPATS
jgi:hypothetical protein